MNVYEVRAEVIVPETVILTLRADSFEDAQIRATTLLSDEVTYPVIVQQIDQLL